MKVTIPTILASFQMLALLNGSIECAAEIAESHRQRHHQHHRQRHHGSAQDWKKEANELLQVNAQQLNAPLLFKPQKLTPLRGSGGEGGGEVLSGNASVAKPLNHEAMRTSGGYAGYYAVFVVANQLLCEGIEADFSIQCGDGGVVAQQNYEEIYGSCSLDDDNDGLLRCSPVCCYGLWGWTQAAITFMCTGPTRDSATAYAVYKGERQYCDWAFGGRLYFNVALYQYCSGGCSSWYQCCNNEYWETCLTECDPSYSKDQGRDVTACSDDIWTSSRGYASLDAITASITDTKCQFDA